MIVATANTQQNLGLEIMASSERIIGVNKISSKPVNGEIETMSPKKGQPLTLNCDFGQYYYMFEHRINSATEQSCATIWFGRSNVTPGKVDLLDQKINVKLVGFLISKRTEYLLLWGHWADSCTNEDRKHFERFWHLECLPTNLFWNKVFAQRSRMCSSLRRYDNFWSRWWANCVTLLEQNQNFHWSKESWIFARHWTCCSKVSGSISSRWKKAPRH